MPEYARVCQSMPEMSKICPRYAQDMPNICPRYAKDTLKIWPRYAQQSSNTWYNNKHL